MSGANFSELQGASWSLEGAVLYCAAQSHLSILPPPPLDLFITLSHTSIGPTCILLVCWVCICVSVHMCACVCLKTNKVVGVLF